MRFSLLVRRAVWWVLRGYQLTLSSFMGRHCRFEPTCSHYAQEAVMRFGMVRGGWLAIKRIGRCGPFGGHGYDPVPDAPANTPAKVTECGCGKH